MRRVLIAVTTVLSLTLVATPTAHAGSTTTKDRANDARARSGEVKSVTLKHSKRYVEVTIRQGPRTADVVEAHLDIRKKKAGPEIELGWESYLSEVVFIDVNDGWNDTGQQRYCRGAKAKGERALTFKVPRRCLRIGGKKPARIRVNVTTYAQDGSRLSDHAPGKRKYGRWVSAG